MVFRLTYGFSIHYQRIDKSGTPSWSPFTSAKVPDPRRERFRDLHDSIRTRAVYVHWVRALIRFDGLRHPAALGGTRVDAFLAGRVSARCVAAATHGQARRRESRSIRASRRWRRKPHGLAFYRPPPLAASIHAPYTAGRLQSAYPCGFSGRHFADACDGGSRRWRRAAPRCGWISLPSRCCLRRAAQATLSRAASGRGAAPGSGAPFRTDHDLYGGARLIEPAWRSNAAPPRIITDCTLQRCVAIHNACFGQPRLTNTDPAPGALIGATAAASSASGSLETAAIPNPPGATRETPPAAAPG